MKREKISVSGIPAVIWGEDADVAYLFVHGKMASKEAAETFARIAEEKGMQTLSFDLPMHGERAEENVPCDVWHGVRDLTTIADYAFSRWKEVRLFACSLGAYFSLNAYMARSFAKCLFQSPIVDMEALIRQMMLWFDVSEERLFREKAVETPIDLMTWEYYQYVLAHPVKSWPFPTAILYAGQDNLQSRSTIEAFTNCFHCELTVSEQSQHPFMEPGDEAIVSNWLRENL